MFLYSRRSQKSVSGASHPSTPTGGEALQRQARQWQIWRSDASSVTRAWNEWLAGESRDRDRLYGRYTSALAEEERAAAELEHTMNLDAKAEAGHDRIGADALSLWERRAR
jgi:hypothetical protein